MVLTHSFRYQTVYLGNSKMMFPFLFLLLVNAALSRESEKLSERYLASKNVIQFTKDDRSPTMFKAEILADGVNGVLVEDFKGIPKINLHLHCSYLSK